MASVEVYFPGNFLGLVLSYFEVTHEGPCFQAVTFNWLSKQGPPPSSLRASTRCEKAGGVEGRVVQGHRSSAYTLSIHFPSQSAILSSNPTNKHTPHTPLPITLSWREWKKSNLPNHAGSRGARTSLRGRQNKHTLHKPNEAQRVAASQEQRRVRMYRG